MTPNKIYVQEFSETQRLMQDVGDNTVGLALKEGKTHKEIPYISRDSIIEAIMKERDKSIRPVARMALTSLLEKIVNL